MFDDDDDNDKEQNLMGGGVEKLVVTCMHEVTVVNPLQDVNLYNHNIASVTISWLVGSS